MPVPVPAHEDQLVKELWGLARPGEPGTLPGTKHPPYRPHMQWLWGESPYDLHAARAGLGTPVPPHARGTAGGGCSTQTHKQLRQGIPLVPQIQLLVFVAGVSVQVGSRMGPSTCFMHPDVSYCSRGAQTEPWCCRWQLCPTVMRGIPACNRTQPRVHTKLWATLCPKCCFPRLITQGLAPLVARQDLYHPMT